jgi:hypothetical protein
LQRQTKPSNSAHVHAAEPPKVQEVEDVEGHRVLRVRNVGLATFPAEASGLSQPKQLVAISRCAQTIYYISVGDYIKGVGHLPLTYMNLTLSDGSVLWCKTVVDAAPENGKTLMKGTVTVTGGSGRFAGANGDGSLAGQRLAPQGTGGDAYFDLVINLKK